jgi:hypothetical protein
LRVERPSTLRPTATILLGAAVALALAATTARAAPQVGAPRRVQSS